MKWLIPFIATTLFACYSIQTEVGPFTPVATGEKIQKYTDCSLDESTPCIPQSVYYGCFKTEEEAKKALDAPFLKNPKIVKHPFSYSDPYLIVPQRSTLQPVDIETILSPYLPKGLLKTVPRGTKGSGIAVRALKQVSFLPLLNSYYLVNQNPERPVIILYNGIYTFEELYKKLAPTYIEKTEDGYLLKAPLYISPTATLIVKNKTLLLQSEPESTFIEYHGKFYLLHSKVYAWDKETRSIPKRTIKNKYLSLLIGKERPRPFILGLRGSYTYFVDNIFDGLGFHSSIATFGLAIFSLKEKKTSLKLDLVKDYINARKDATGLYVGNTIKNQTIGFYCTKIDKAALIGNLFYDNVIYDIDPHDYATNLIIARNVTAKAKYAHGIIISRGVENSIIAQNMSFNNGSSGIMTDRLSNHTLIYDNLVFLNHNVGISVQESDDTLIQDNIVIANKNSGIYVRNGLRTEIKNNTIMSNATNGIEILTMDLSKFVYRDLPRDPYHKATAAWVENNTIDANILYAISVKNSAAIHLQNNRLINTSFKTFGGDLAPFTANIDKKFTLYGIGNPFHPKSNFYHRLSKKAARKLMQNYLDIDTDWARAKAAAVTIQYLHDYKKALSLLRPYLDSLEPSISYTYGYALFFLAKSPQERIHALSYIAQSYILGKDIAHEIFEMPYTLPVTKKEIEKAFDEAEERLEQNQEALAMLKQFRHRLNLARGDLFTLLAPPKEYSLFTPQVLRKIHNIFQKNNVPKLRYFEQLKREEEELRQKLQKCQNLFRQQIKKERQTQFFLENRAYYIKKLDQLIERYLKLVNQFRLNPITKEQIYQLAGVTQ